jgi:hypothetical protein
MTLRSIENFYLKTEKLLTGLLMGTFGSVVFFTLLTLIFPILGYLVACLIVLLFVVAIFDLILCLLTFLIQTSDLVFRIFKVIIDEQRKRD